MIPPGPTRDTAAALDDPDDDGFIGRILTRREVLALFGAGGAAAFIAACTPSVGSGGTPVPTRAASPGTSASAAASASPAASSSAGALGTVLPACVVAPELTEGPYYLAVDLERADIRPNTADGVVAPGAVLTLEWLVSQADSGACVPMADVVVDVWHCDAGGVYSGVSGNSGNFLRGFQRTDADGRAAFTTIYPGWYSGRAVHIHFKIRTDPDASAGFEFTSQLFFPDDVSKAVYATGVYAQKGPQDVPNASDQIYNQSRGQTLMTVTQNGDAYKATFPIAVTLT
jgi:protocatechuate 3,4-dioxygenase beta subunit